MWGGKRVKCCFKYLIVIFHDLLLPVKKLSSFKLEFSVSNIFVYFFSLTFPSNNKSHTANKANYERLVFTSFKAISDG